MEFKFGFKNEGKLTQKIKILEDPLLFLFHRIIIFQYIRLIILHL